MFKLFKKVKIIYNLERSEDTSRADMCYSYCFRSPWQGQAIDAKEMGNGG